jgi:hypothetical protein
MPKRYHKRHSKGGGFFDSIQQSFNNLSNSVQNSASSMLNKTKKTDTTYQPSTYQPSAYQPSASSYNSSYQPSMTSYGGRRRTRKRMRGGYKPSHSLNNIAATASPVHGLETARAHNWVGGRRRRKRRTRTRRY